MYQPFTPLTPAEGAVGRHGSIAIVERFIRTMKEEGLRRVLVLLRRHAFEEELARYIAWHNDHRPHTALNGATPDERYFGKRPANRVPRWEPREHWPRTSPCLPAEVRRTKAGARPQALVKGRPGARL